MSTHPQAGKPVKIANGPLKGQYFVVIGWFVEQFQGKSIEKLIKTQAQHLGPVKLRGYPVDSEVVWGRLYPNMDFIRVHEKELLVDMKEVKTEDGGTVELPPNVEPLLSKGKGKARMKSVKGGSSGKESASKTDEAGSSPATPANEGGSDDSGSAS